MRLYYLRYLLILKRRYNTDMKQIFNDSFFRFLLGFVAILTVSFALTFAIDIYAQKQQNAQNATVVEVAD